MKNNDLPKIIPIFPLSNFIIFPKTTVPLNICEPRYLDMVNGSMKSDKLIGCHMVGEHASEIIQMAAIALGMGASKSDFDRTMALHPTIAEEFVTMI